MSGLSLAAFPAARENTRLLVVPVVGEGDALAAVPAFAVPGLDRLVSALQRDPRVSAEAGSVAPVVVAGAGEDPDLMAVSLGDERNADAVRDAFQAAASETLGRDTCFVLPDGVAPAAAVRAAAEGILIGRFRPDGSSDTDGTDDALVLAVPTGLVNDPAITSAFATGLAAGRAANWVRHLVELPPSRLWPERLADIIATRARELGFEAQVWDRAAMLAQGFGGTAAVGVGSANGPRVVVLKNTCPPGARPLGLAGKGMTFDAGGINLKRDLHEIHRMKDDMAGAAAVAGALFAAAELGLSVPVIAVLPMAENMPSGTAQRSGDIITHPDGQTSEVVDTDCEGRLILADALAWLRRQGVSGLIDVGTLTDGGGVGPLLWGAWSNDDALAEAVFKAGAAAGEPGWRLPLKRQYRDLLESRVADIANAPLSHADIGLTAATFLSVFADDTPWVHIDNGSSAFLEEDIGVWEEGATGSPARALLQLLIDRAGAASDA